MEPNIEKYKRIVESTIIECNRVLDIRQKERKTTFYGAELSIFRGYLSRFVRHEFGHKYGIRISNTNPYCVVTILTAKNSMVFVIILELSILKLSIKIIKTMKNMLKDNHNYLIWIRLVSMI